MLDENLRVLGRRINDLEIQLEDKKDAIEKVENEKFELQEKISVIQS